ncbi:unnamed protein product [Diatraea saccharalis]|uniref:Uncharacterized protein n=1 Tax=Diatraea saccharalis TaxID=40085 RepID=A0A9N9RGK9_9NEOP|nr:unnamed protein product [Diatraea saccharalis]
MTDRLGKRRGSEFPQPVSTPPHQNQSKRRQSSAQVRSYQDERPDKMEPSHRHDDNLSRKVPEVSETESWKPDPDTIRVSKGSPSTREERKSANYSRSDSKRQDSVEQRKMYTASSESELFECAILPIFHKLLTERHKSQPHGLNLSYGVSCPNISIKCDIVEYELVYSEFVLGKFKLYWKRNKMIMRLKQTVKRQNIEDYTKNAFDNGDETQDIFSVSPDH